MKRMLSAILLLSMLMFTACGAQSTASSEATASSSEAASSEEATEAEATTLTDLAGNTIELKDEYTKIISYAPSITEILIELGYGDKIIAVTSVDTTEGLPENVEILEMMNPDIESITAMQPDLIISSGITGDGQSDPFAEVRKTGTTVVEIPTAANIAEIYDSIELIGTVLKAEEKATEIVDNMKATVEEISAKTADIEEKKTVYFEIAAAPYMYTTGANTYLHEMIEICGGVNIFADSEGWVAPTDELILSKNPQVIISNVDYIEAPLDEIKARNGWDAVSAVAEGHVYSVDNMTTSLPNQSILTGLDQISKTLYPEIFGE